MELRKAIRMAQKNGRGIARRSQFPRPIWFIPTNTTEKIIVVGAHGLSSKWEPSADDLIAKDWIVYG
ncbi:Thoeris anti-defense Tad2 family protein [Lactiplantibacillus plantarum]|uniref:Thoeris anti-defense Tad2 family protein n=1 Tax=Lactiplantibacillus plantarum TaxID=1590 RepID=UPI000E09BB6F|nr:hypothetical protein [Lactiplantibacillus plantarum]AYC70872.1 hypothetical protein D5289_02050 [Lactiplantibacillus plantarum]QDJ20224.1 hypothetical protein LLY606_08710 [Lactiplantibacillus plantarum]RDG03335.1 hypothetical protein DQM19_03525 [Lactiplantibacillus plantarum]GJI52857.1 DUF2829 domain-containing protein [Lactiplantibacillus plantarum]